MQKNIYLYIYVLKTEQADNTKKITFKAKCFRHIDFYVQSSAFVLQNSQAKIKFSNLLFYWLKAKHSTIHVNNSLVWNWEFTKWNVK